MKTKFRRSFWGAEQVCILIGSWIMTQNANISISGFYRFCKKKKLLKISLNSLCMAMVKNHLKSYIIMSFLSFIKVHCKCFDHKNYKGWKLRDPCRENLHYLWKRAVRIVGFSKWSIWKDEYIWRIKMGSRAFTKFEINQFLCL